MYCSKGKSQVGASIPKTPEWRSSGNTDVQNPKRQKEEWIHFITTAKAKTRLQAALRKDKKQIAAKGENIFNNFLEENGLAKNDLSIVDKILNHFGIDKKEELFYQLGSNNISLDESVKKLFKNKSQNVFMKYLKMPFGGNNKSTPVPVKPESVAAPDRKIDRKATYILRDDGKEKNYTIRSLLLSYSRR